MPTMLVPTAPHTATRVAAEFSQAVVAADADTLERLVTDDVWFRVLLPRATVEHHGAQHAIGTMLGWFADAHELELLAVHTGTVEGRERVGWLVRLRPAWAPDTWHLIEQTGYVRVVDGHIRRIDLVCTGYHPQT